MADYAMSWCQECHRWVPEKKMNYFDGQRVCQWCLDGVPTPEHLVHDPNFGKTQCLYCDSYDTTEQAPNWGTFKCNSCGEIFKIYLGGS